MKVVGQSKYKQGYNKSINNTPSCYKQPYEFVFDLYSSFSILHIFGYMLKLNKEIWHFVRKKPNKKFGNQKNPKKHIFLATLKKNLATKQKQGA